MKDKLLKIQAALKAPKGQTNKFGNYNYRSCEDILEAVKPLCVEHGCVLIVSDAVVEIGGRVYVKATARLFEGNDKDITDQTWCLEASGYAREPESRKGMDDSQITGSASSYARKYALNGLFCIDDTKDADATNDHGKKPAQKAAPAKKKAVSSGKTKKTTALQEEILADWEEYAEYCGKIPDYEMVSIKKACGGEDWLKYDYDKMVKLRDNIRSARRKVKSQVELA